MVDPNYRSHFLLTKGYIHYERGEYELAAQSYQEAYECKPEQTEALFLKALACKKAGDGKGSLEALQAILRKDPHHLRAKKMLRSLRSLNK
jgi:tetratricopeptide (TPR) repeat protein